MWFQAVARNADEVLLPAAAFMVRPALLGTSNLTPLAGPSNPRLAKTVILARGTPAERKEPAVTVSIESLRLCVAWRAPRAERRRFDRLPGALAL